MDIRNLTNGKLADHIDRVVSDRDTAMGVVWALASGPSERWMDLVERLGDPAMHEIALEYRAVDPRHPALIAFREADERWEEARYEARRRCGPISASTLYTVVLRQSPRSKAA